MSTAPTRRTSPRSRVIVIALFGLVLGAILAAVLSGGNSSPTIVGSGVPESQARSLPPFTNVDMNGITNLNLQIGPRQSVIVRADSNIIGRVTTRVVSGTLVVGTKPGSYSIKTPIIARLVVPSLVILNLNGVGDATADGIDGAALIASLNGAGSIRASGTTAKLRIAINGAGTARLEALKARDATAVVNGAGDVTLTATDSLSAIVNGSGTLTYYGNPPHVTRSVAGSGDINPG